MMNEIDVFYTNREIKKTNTYRGDYQHNNLYCVYYSKVRHRLYCRRKNINNIGIKSCALLKCGVSHTMQW